MTGADIYMKTCKEKALEWNVSPRSVNDMCKKGRIQGAIKEKGSWLIPDDSPKPMDGRVSNGKYIKKNMVAKAEVKSLPIGISDYVRAQEEYYYVDKTLLIKEFLDQKPLVSLFTRPRRFGKTLNMDMLRVFFEISDKNTSKYFADKNIWQCGEEYRSHQGKYPVIFLTFKDVKFDTWDATIDKIRGLLQEEYGRHQELLNSDKLSQYEKEYFTKIISATANEVELTSSLERLSKMLASHYDKAPVIIIDEYDFLLNSLNAKSIIEKYDVIVDCTDNFYTRGIISRTCVENRKKCVFGAVSEFNGFIFTHVENSACFECIIGDYEKLCEQKSTVGVMGAMVGIISSMQALEVIKLILGIGSLAINKMIVVDGNDFSTSIIPISRNNNCYCKRNCL